MTDVIKWNFSIKGKKRPSINISRLLNLLSFKSFEFITDEYFDKPKADGNSTQTIIASAIGHAQDVSLFEKLADKKFITPTQFGHYLKDMYNGAAEELQQ